MCARLYQNENYDQIIERQVNEWRRSREKSGEITHHAGDIDYITISREMGSGGEEIAQILSELMGWQRFDKEILNYMSENMDVHVRTLESVDERTVSWINDWLVPLFSSKPEGHVEQLTYYKHLGKVLMVIAKHGKAIIVGRAANIVLPRERGLAVRVTAPFELRCKRYAREHDIRLGEAMQLIEKNDERQARFVKDFISRDIDNPINYDIVVNTEKLTPTAVAKLLWRALDERVSSKREHAQAKAAGEDVARIVEKQMEQWEQEWDGQQIAPGHAHLTTGAEIDYITLTRDERSGGTETARMISDIMQWQLYDHEILDYMAKRMDVHVRMLEGLDEKSMSWINDRLMPFLSGKSSEYVKQSRYYQHLGEQLLIISMHGRAVIIGRAAAQILPREKGLSVRITAPLELRASRYASEYGVSLEDARNAVKKADAEYKRFVKSFVDKDVDDVAYYDLICNTEKLTPRSVARLVCRTFEQRLASQIEQHGETPEHEEPQPETHLHANE